MPTPTSLPDLENARVAVIGLGYVGLPLAVEFGKSRPTIGFDINTQRVKALQNGTDDTGEMQAQDIRSAKYLSITSSTEELRGCDVFIVTVPTPIDVNRQPDLSPLMAASRLVGSVIAEGGIVIYESTVYPGATEEDCLPIVEAASGLKLNQDFFAGYSPERISPGDKNRTLTSITKVTSGSSVEAANFVDALYQTIIPAGTYRASSMRVAEAAKVIENTQRDVSIALINELSIIFSHLGLDTSEVLDAAATKWNFNRLNPGLVGGHCIGVDPYYLVHKSQAAGYIPDIIRTSREINDGMARVAADLLIRAMIDKGAVLKGGRVLVLGLSYKENCADLRNTKVADMANALRNIGLRVDVCDPIVDRNVALAELDEQVLTELPDPSAVDYDAVVLAVPHGTFVDLGAEGISRFKGPHGVFFDMKSVFEKNASDLRL